MVSAVPLVQLMWLLSSVVTLPRWSFWVLVAVLLMLDVIGAVTEGREAVIGNGNGGIVHPAMMQVDPNVQRVLQHAQVNASNLVGIAVIGITKDLRAVNICAMPDHDLAYAQAITELGDVANDFRAERRKMKQAAQEAAPPTVGKILRPPPILGG